MEMFMAHRSEREVACRDRSRVVSAVVQGNLLSATFTGIIAVLLLAGESALGQFLISPLKLDNIQLQSGRRMGRVMTIENTTGQLIDQVDLAIVDVMQDPNGTWTPIDPGDPNVDRSSLRSCATWLALDRSTMRLAPFQRVTFNLQITAPPRMQGHYCAAITAKGLLPSGAAVGYNSPVAVQYVIPVLIEVLSRALPNEVELTNVGLAFQPLSFTTPAATVATLGVTNKGGTFCRLQGYIRVSNWWGGHWRRITECQFSDIGILPGNKLLLKRDVGKPLPKGKYKLEGFLVVNGVRADQIENQAFEFDGDPRAAQVTGDAALDFDPRELVVDGVPGSLRTAKIQVVNATDDTVNVTADLALPSHLSSLVTTDPNTNRRITGEEYGCNNWITIEPSQFQLGPYGRQNLFLKIDIPQTATGLPNYYAVMDLRSKYPDGQPAGTTSGRICLLMKKTSGAPKLVTNSVQISELAPTKYLVFARTTNMGTTHALPSCYAAVLTPTGELRRRVQMSSELYNQVGNQLPLETRNFSGVLDIAGLPAGQYVLGISLETEKYPAEQSQTGLIIKDSNGVKTVESVGVEAVGGKIKAKF
jgi:hypothetical protein